jgi:alkylation response protein AidB-like acyl-CoA dehydrogenase
MQIREPEHISEYRDVLQRFVEKEMPRDAAAEWDRTDTYPRDVVEKLAGLGVMGLTIPEEYGGAGRDIYATMVVIEELCKRSTAISGPYIMATCYGGMNIVESGSEAQRKELLPKLANGEILFAYGLTEPDVGADLASVKTRVEQRDGKLIVNGSKRFCTGAKYADYIYTLARSDNDAGRYKNLSLVLVPRNSPGIEVTEIETIGQRGVGTTDVHFDDVEIPVENIVGGEAGWNNGWSMLAGPTLDVEKLEVAAMALGVGEGAMEDAWQYAQERVQFGKPIAAQQAIRHSLARCRTQLLAARLMLYHAAGMADRNEPCTVETSMAKLFVCQEVQEVVLACQRIFGAYGCVTGSDMDRYMREALVFPIAGGSTEIQLNNIANRMGLPRS